MPVIHSFIHSVICEIIAIATSVINVLYARIHRLHTDSQGTTETAVTGWIVVDG